MPLLSLGWPTWAEGLVIYAGCLLAWSLGLYVVTRGGLRRIPLLTAAATLVLVVYQLGQALGALAPDPTLWLDWARRTWWAAALAPGIWLVLIVSLAADEAPDDRTQESLRRQTRIIVAVASLAALLFAITGGTSTLVVNWAEESNPMGPPHVPPGPLFAAYQIYVVACLGVAAALLAVLWRKSATGTPLRARFRWLLVSSIGFLAAGAYITTASGLFGFSALPGQLLLSAGLILMAWNLARYGALLAGETVKADLVGFSLTMAAVVGGYGLLMLAVVPHDFAWLERLLPALLVLMASHVLADRQNVLLDRLVYGATATTLRAGLRELSDRVVRQPDPTTALAEVNEGMTELVREQSAELIAASPQETPELRLLVEGALRRMNDLPALSRHALLDRLVPSDDAATALERAAQLRGELELAITRLRPPGPRPGPGSAVAAGPWLHFLVLHEAYVEGRPNKQIMQRYSVSESSFHRARRRAVDAVADDLDERLRRPAVRF
jgi:N-terminal 7TM region of histidine kinase